MSSADPYCWTTAPVVVDRSTQSTVVEPGSVPPEELGPDVEPAPEPDAPDDAPVSDPDELAPDDPPPLDPRVPPELDAEPESSLPTEPSPDAGTDVRQATLADKTTPRRPP
jgi:hypothetical protein